MGSCLCSCGASGRPAYCNPHELAGSVQGVKVGKVERVPRERKALEVRLAKERSECEALAQRIAGIRMVAPRKVGENDVLYGSVTSGDIAEFLKGKGVEIDKRRVLLDEPIK